MLVPLYKAFGKRREAKRLNAQLEQLADQYQSCLNSNDPAAETSLKLARQAVITFNADVRLSVWELPGVIPAVVRFPFWYTWL